MQKAIGMRYAFSLPSGVVWAHDTQKEAIVFATVRRGDKKYPA